MDCNDRRSWTLPALRDRFSLIGRQKDAENLRGHEPNVGNRGHERLNYARSDFCTRKTRIIQATVLFTS